MSETAPNMLVVGHSHVGAIRKAAETADMTNVKVINLRTIGEAEPLDPETGKANTDIFGGFRPDIVCISMQGNRHNILGIIEHPTPFSIGDAHLGAVPADSSRRMIPRAIALEAFATATQSGDKIAKAVLEAYPGVVRLSLCPPPPMGDWNHIAANPGPFEADLPRGPPPPELRLALYELEVENKARFADEVGARLVRPAAPLVGVDGFLDPEYYGADPTHANEAYGAIMIERLFLAAEAAQ